MEMSYEEWCEARKGIKRYLSTSSWAFLIYYFIVNVTVIGWIVAEITIGLLRGAISDDFASIEEAILNSAENAWGYFLAAAIGFAILLIWKKPGYLRNEIFAKGGPMKAGSFLTLLCMMFGGQMVFKFYATALELLLNAFGYSIVKGLETLQAEPDNLSMFLYAGVLAPVTEELLFRGLIQRSMLPFGKKFAIFVSALTFGLFHANPLQSPYAFVIGLLLGYVAVEYNIVWAMVLHISNNLLLGDLIYRVLGGLQEETVNLIVFGIILAFAVAAIILMIAKRKKIAAWLRGNRMIGAYVGCYFSCLGTIILLIVMGLSMITNSYAMITPL